MLHGVRGWQFVSHKFLRWLTLVPLILLLISTGILATNPAITVLLGLQVIFYSLAFAGLILAFAGTGGAKMFSVPFYVLLGSFGERGLLRLGRQRSDPLLQEIDLFV